MNDGPADLTSLRAVVNHRHVVEILSAHGVRYLATAARDGSAQLGARAGSVRQGQPAWRVPLALGLLVFEPPSPGSDISAAPCSPC